MNLPHNLRERLTHHKHPDSAPNVEGSASADPSDPPPVEGYDRFTTKELFVQLHHYTQAQLAAIEEYERAHQNRTAVLNKLHYMRGAQPWEGYDDMEPEEIVAELEQADDETIKHVRDYEHKFRDRPIVMEAAMRLHHERVAAHPPEAPPAYQPGGGSHKDL